MAMASLEDHEDANYAYAAQIADALSFPMVMQAAIELDLLGIIARAGPGSQLSAAEIATALSNARNPDAPAILDRMLFLLATFSVVTCTAVEGGVERKYGLAPVAKYFVADEDGVSLAPLVCFNQGKVFFDSWTKLKEAVLEGGVPFDKVHGMHIFEYSRIDKRFSEMFNKAMYNQSTYIMKKILRRYKGLDHMHTLVDVGGGLGQNLRLITSHNPSIKGINFDLPHVIENASPIPGVQNVAGDMFKSIPQGDAIFMKWTLHDWSDDDCLKLLKRCYKALPEKGKVIVVEKLMPEQPKKTDYSRAISELDVSMMTIIHGAKERTRKEFEALAKASGFAELKLDCCVCTFWVMEFYK